MYKLVIHTCCSDCLLKMVNAVMDEFHYNREEILLYFCNPNIHPESEWLARKAALQLIAEREKLALKIKSWKPDDYFSSLASFTDSMRRDSRIRCLACYRVRLEQAAQFAKEQSICSFSSTMLSSSYLDVEKVSAIGLSIASSYGLSFIRPQSINTCLHTRGFYKQNYCGCIYSLEDRYREKYLLRGQNSDEAK